MKAKQVLVTTAWALSALVAMLAFVVWGQGNSWQLSGLSLYQIFPLFGLLAFSLMWSHYIVAALRVWLNLDRSVTHFYFEATSFVVLLAILIHPGLLSLQLFNDGAGLPPGSELHYVLPALRIWILVAMTSWLIFLAYELRRIFGKKPWWKYMQYLSDLAMIGIFFHALNLGSQLVHGWFRTVWYVYGVTLAGALIYMYYKKFAPKPAPVEPTV